MLQRHIASCLRHRRHADQMHQRLIPEIKPRAWKSEIRPFTGKKAKNVAIPIDHGVKIGGADIDVIKRGDGHGVY